MKNILIIQKKLYFIVYMRARAWSREPMVYILSTVEPIAPKVLKN